MAKRILRFSPSGLDNLGACNVRYLYGHAMNLQKKPALKYQKEPDESMEKGSFMHHMLEEYYNSIIDKSISPEKIVSIIKDAERKAINLPISIDASAEVIYQFKEYITFYNTDRWIPILAEKPFSVLFYEDEYNHVLFEGKIDLIVEISGSSPIVDHKTTGKKDNTPAQLQNQAMGYLWVTKKNLFIINEIGFQKTVKKQERFRRISLSYTDKQLEEWRKWTEYRIREFLMYEKQGIFPMNFSACKFCAFQSICATTEDNREWKIKTEYEQRPAHDLFDKQLKAVDGEDLKETIVTNIPTTGPDVISTSINGIKVPSLFGKKS